MLGVVESCLAKLGVAECGSEMVGVMLSLTAPPCQQQETGSVKLVGTSGLTQ